MATLGPSSQSAKSIKQLFQAGVDVFRLNFSHGTHAIHKKSIQHIRDLEEKEGRLIGILLDLQGPKLRVGTFLQQQVRLEKNQTFQIDLNPKPGDKTRVCLPHPEVFDILKPGLDLLVDDGRLKLEVVVCSKGQAETIVRTSGVLSDRKGVNVPGAFLPISAITDKDKKDLAFGLALGVDWVALSFVQKPEDVLEAKSLIQGQAKLIAKLEKPMAIEHLEEIVSIVDGLMVARGDLGVELPPEDVPSLQKRIVRCCREAGKPVIVATQMLDSMVGAPTPTRAEASDVATAVYDGVDAVMLSAESASGQYPVEAVTMMDRIIQRVEQDSLYQEILDTSRFKATTTTADAVVAAARGVAHIIQVSAMVTFTESGFTALRAARERPESPILALTPNAKTARFLNLVWGTHPIQTHEVLTFTHMVDTACQVAYRQQFATEGDDIIVVAGVPFGVSGGTNILRIARIEEEEEDF